MNPSLWLENEFCGWCDLLADGRRISKPSGTIIYQQHDTLDHFFYLLEGIVKVSIFDCEGREKVIGLQSSHSLFGMDCFCAPRRAVVTTTALTHVKMVRVPHTKLQARARRDPELGIQLSRYYSKLLSLMCIETECQSFCDTLTRIVSYFFLYMDAPHGDEPIVLDLTSERLASLVATTRVNVSRVLTKLIHRGLIEKRRGRIVVLDRRRLFELCRIPNFDDTADDDVHLVKGAAAQRTRRAPLTDRAY